MAKSSSQKVSKKTTKKTTVAKKGKRTWNIYAARTLKGINAKMSLASKTKAIINSFVNDIFERLAVQAAQLARVNKKKTLGSREMQTAVRLVLPAELAKHAMSEGTKAVAKL
jgi:histone H3/H4